MDRHKYSNLDLEATDLFSIPFNTYRTERINGMRVVKKQDEYNAFMAHAISIASAEVEDQRKTFKWHMLPMQNGRHRKALTMVDEYALGNLECEGLELGGGRKEEGTGNEESNVEATYPKLCPLVQKGIDRQWLTRQLCSREEVEYSLDTLASFKCTISRPTALKIAQLTSSK